ncbi:MAG: hypothetical protein K9L62_00320 [Vallitaleaceae bacterium]|nr:hypothetical protein [Vallitaleaceae bacterium]
MKAIYKAKRVDDNTVIYFNEYGAYCDKDGNVLEPKRFIRDCGYKVIPESIEKFKDAL